MKAVPDYSFETAPKPKIVVVCAQRGSGKLNEWLKQAATDPETDIVTSVCTGVFKLAGAGLLDGKAATWMATKRSSRILQTPKRRRPGDVAGAVCDRFSSLRFRSALRPPAWPRSAGGT